MFPNSTNGSVFERQRKWTISSWPLVMPAVWESTMTRRLGKHPDRTQCKSHRQHSTCMPFIWVTTLNWMLKVRRMVSKWAKQVQGDWLIKPPRGKQTQRWIKANRRIFPKSSSHLRFNFRMKLSGTYRQMLVKRTQLKNNFSQGDKETESFYILFCLF